MHLPTFFDEVLARLEVRQASEKAPRAPMARTSTAAAFNGKSQVDLLFLGDILALRVKDVFSTCSLLMLVRAKNPQEVWGAFRNSWIRDSGPPSRIQMDEGGE